jgi:hypothetical protein
MNESGLKVTRRQLLYAVEREKIPKPFITASGDFSWRQEDIESVVRYFQSPRPLGRPRKVQK